jgi:hypothetical protein
MLPEMPNLYSMFTERPPEIVFRDGLAHISYTIGHNVFEFVMLPSTYNASYADAGGKLRDFQARACFVREFPEEKERQTGKG